MQPSGKGSNILGFETLDTPVGIYIIIFVDTHFVNTFEKNLVTPLSGMFQSFCIISSVGFL